MSKNKEFKFIDLFCGIGGFHQAMQQLGGKCVYACDINIACRNVYKNNFCINDEFVIDSDIKKAVKENCIPQFDVLCGGFPCQTFSKAGKRNGFDVIKDDDGNVKDDRGQLFYKIIDILNQHPECKYVILENVRNLADNKENWNIVCEKLKQLGFVITEDPIIESPHHFGVPQIRERVYILGVKSEFIDKRRKMPLGYITRDILSIDNYYEECQANCIEYIIDQNVDEKYFLSAELSQLLNIWEEFKDNIEGLKTPFWLHKAGLGIETREEYINDPDIGYLDMPKWKKLLVMKSRIMYENNREFIDDWANKYHMTDRSLIHQKFEWNVGNDCESIKDGIIQIRQSGVRVKRPNYFPSLVAMSNTPIIWDHTHECYRYITPQEAAKLQSFNKNYKFGTNDSATYRQLGNSVNVKLVKIFAKELFRLGKQK